MSPVPPDRADHTLALAGPPGLLSAVEAAELLDVSRYAVNRYRQRGILRGIPVGGVYVYAEEDVLALRGELLEGKHDRRRTREAVA